MKRPGLFAAALALTAFPCVASAQLDHLVCYKALDRLTPKAAFDLFAELQPEFSAKGCALVKVVDFCVPSTKLNVDPATADQRSDIAGPALHVDYIGYLVKCSSQLAPSNKVVIDQFGTHRQGKYKVYKVYVPAKKGPPPCGTVDGKSCGGVCPNATDQCRIGSDGVCKCAPPPTNTCEGKPDKQGQCGGPCPDPTQQCKPTVSSTGAKVCACGPPPPPRCGINTASGTCGGECPNPAEKCTLKSPNECICGPADTPCALEAGTAATCSGDCPIAGDVCEFDAAGNACRCGAPPPSPCEQNPLTGQCGGSCPPGAICRIDAAGACNCGPTPCGGDAAGQCAGSCPATAQTCHLDASGACNCDPPSCTVTGVDTCGGLCPPGRNCAATVAGTSFRCICQ